MDGKWQSWDIFAHYYIHFKLWGTDRTTDISSYVTGSFCSKLFSVPDCLNAGIFQLLLFTFLTLLGCQCLIFDCSNFCLSNTYIFVPVWWKTTLVQAVQRAEVKSKFTKVGKESQSLGSRWKGHNQLHKQGTKRAQLSSRLSSQGGTQMSEKGWSFSHTGCITWLSLPSSSTLSSKFFRIQDISPSCQRLLKSSMSFQRDSGGEEWAESETGRWDRVGPKGGDRQQERKWEVEGPNYYFISMFFWL